MLRTMTDANSLSALSFHVLFSVAHQTQTVNRNISQSLFPSSLLSASASFPWEDPLTGDLPSASLAGIPDPRTHTPCAHLTQKLSFLYSNQLLLLTSLIALTVLTVPRAWYLSLYSLCFASLLTSCEIPFLLKYTSLSILQT